MATNQTFDDLIGRIDVATTTLENATVTVTEGSANVEEAVIEAQQAVVDAKVEVTKATTQANTATVQASKATTEAVKATNEAIKAINAVEDAKKLAPFQEAPKDNQTYGRKDGVWTVVGSDGGAGTVTAVNGVLPDETGNVAIDIPTPVEQVNSDWNASSGKAQILNKPALFSGSYNDLSNKPTIPTVPSNLSAFNNDEEFVSEAPIDGEQYARKNGDWIKVETAGGGHATEESYYLGSKAYSTWAKGNPNDPIQLSQVGNYVLGEWYTGKGLLTVDGLQSIPSGRYWYSSNEFPNTTPLSGKSGYIEVVPTMTSEGDFSKGAIANVVVNNQVTMQYSLNFTANVWVAMGLQSAQKVGNEAFSVSSKLQSLGISEALVGMLWSGAFGNSVTLVSRTNGATSPEYLPVGMYRFTSNTEMGGTSSSMPLYGREAILWVLDFQTGVNVKRTGKINTKVLLAMSWLPTATNDIKFHIWNGNQTWITK